MSTTDTAAAPTAPPPPADSPLRAAQEAAGAVWTEVAGRRVARHYGDQEAEYYAVNDAVGVAERGDRARIRMWGKDPARMLHGLVTNDMLNARPEQGVYAAMLTPKGRTIAELRAFRRQRPDGPEVLVELPREALAGTVDHFRKFVPPMFARWADASAAVGELGAYGPKARKLVAYLFGIDPPLAEDVMVEAEFAGAPVLVVSTRYVGLVDGFDLFAPVEALGPLWEAMLEGGARPVGLGAIETLRIEAARPRYGAELTEEVIPMETFQDSGELSRVINFSKGCYTGQEVIIRILHRGHVNRLLRGLDLGGAPAPARGAPVALPGQEREMGRVTSAAVSPSGK
ncbi:MAG TPA: hypothetical protein VFQ39_00955, partial [Longimicrobium sp.]|nr:hypothetical protein [Longimicrobium sp.]